MLFNFGIIGIGNFIFISLLFQFLRNSTRVATERYAFIRYIARIFDVVSFVCCFYVYFVFVRRKHSKLLGNSRASCLCFFSFFLIVRRCFILFDSDIHRQRQRERSRFDLKQTKIISMLFVIFYQAGCTVLSFTLAHLKCCHPTFDVDLQSSLSLDSRFLSLTGALSFRFADYRLFLYTFCVVKCTVIKHQKKKSKTTFFIYSIAARVIFYFLSRYLHRNTKRVRSLIHLTQTQKLE